MRARSAALAALVLGFSCAAAAAQEVSEETVQFFRTNCASCHTVGGGRLTGPDLEGVTERRPREWLVRFVADPKAVIDGGDPVGQELLRDARGTYMPTLPGLAKDRIEKLLDLIAYESAQEKSRFAGTQVSDRPLTPADVELGRRLFLGEQRLEAGGPACVSCHGVADLPGLGGGRLGPDLTEVFARLEGRKALTAWLTSPASPTMQPIFAEQALSGDEVLAVVAYLRSAAERGAPPAQSSGSFLFLVAGASGLVLALLAFDHLWRGRHRGVRRRLVEESRR